MDTLVASVVTPIVYSKTIHVFLSFVCAQLQYYDYRKWRVRHDNCELLPMIRRRLQRMPRMQPVLHDSVVKSYVFDHLELATKSFLLLPRNCIHCYSSASRWISNSKMSNIARKYVGTIVLYALKCRDKNNALADIVFLSQIIAMI